MTILLLAPDLPADLDLDADGSPHVTYYDQSLLLSFTWDGRARYINVAHGGYGEPVRWVIPVEPTGGKVHLGAFAEVCDRWVTDFEEAGHPFD